MKAVWMQDKKLEVRTIRQPEVGDGEALLQVLLAGICGTDLQLIRGYYHFSGVPGHEFVAQVISAPDRPALEGKRVVADINLGCGHCEQCSRRNAHHCMQRRVVGIKDYQGAFAECLVLPLQNLYVVPESLSDQAAVFCEPLAAAASVLAADFGGQEKKAQKKVLLIGAGKLGLLIAQVLQARGFTPQVVVRHPRHQALLEKWGVSWLSEEHVGRSQYSTVIEASGSDSGFALALTAVEPQGTVILKSTYKEHPRMDTARIVVDEICLKGSRCGDMAQGLELLQDHNVNVTDLIDSQFPLQQIDQAFAKAQQPGALKVLLHMA